MDKVYANTTLGPFLSVTHTSFDIHILNTFYWKQTSCKNTFKKYSTLWTVLHRLLYIQWSSFNWNAIEPLDKAYSNQLIKRIRQKGRYRTRLILMLAADKREVIVSRQSLQWGNFILDRDY